MEVFFNNVVNVAIFIRYFCILVKSIIKMA